MAADPQAIRRALARRPRRRQSDGFALFAVVVILTVAAILATAVAVTLSGDNDQARIERAADILHRLVAEIDTTRVATAQSFRGQVAKHPGRLSHLYTKILTTDRSCNGTYSGAQVGNWRGPYHLVPISTAGHNIAPGFFAQDSLVRLTANDLAIEIPNVSLADAKGLELFVEKKSDGSGPIVTYAPTGGTSPVVVRYHIAVAGC
jgi:type II secretory pathway pseudopilin PulG